MKLSRRNFLKGIAGTVAVVASPPLPREAFAAPQVYVEQLTPKPPSITATSLGELLKRVYDAEAVRALEDLSTPMLGYLKDPVFEGWGGDELFPVSTKLR